MSAFYIVFLVILGQTPATEGHAGFPQMTVLSRYDSEHACTKAIKQLDLTDEQKESLVCMRVMRSDVKWVEA